MLEGELSLNIRQPKVECAVFVGICFVQSQGIWGPFLVVAPASTLHNWQQEVARFMPKFKVTIVLKITLSYLVKAKKFTKKFCYKAGFPCNCMKSVRLSAAYIPLTNIKTIVYDYITPKIVQNKMPHSAPSNGYHRDSGATMWARGARHICLFNVL